MTTERKTCAICEEPLYMRWTDVHGFAICQTCGIGYQVYFYDENKKRVEKEYEVDCKLEALDLIKRFWKETKSRISPGTYFIPGSDRGITNEQIETWNAWMTANAPVEVQP